MALDSVAIFPKCGDCGYGDNPSDKHNALKEGMPIAHVDESSWGDSLEGIISTETKKIFPVIKIPRSFLPYIENAYSEMGCYFNGEGRRYIDTPNDYRIKNKYIKLSELASICGDTSLENAWRSSDPVPIQDLTSVPLGDLIALLRDPLERPLSDPDIPDYNSVSSGDFNVGSGQTYLLWALAWADTANLTNDLNFTGTSATIETGSATYSINLNGFIQKNTHNYNHLGIPNRNTNLISTNHNSDLFRPINSNTGTIIIEKFSNKRIVNGLGSAACFVECSSAVTLKIRNCLYDNNGFGNGNAVFTNSANTLFHIHNMKSWNIVDNSSFNFVNSNASSIIENCISYHPGVGRGFRFVSAMTARNCYSDGLTTYGGPHLLGTFSKCGATDTDGSEASLDNMTTANEYISVNPASNFFLVPKITGLVYNFGDTSLGIAENIAGIGGNERPTGDGTVSIGANQWNNAAALLINSGIISNSNINGRLVS